VVNVLVIPFKNNLSEGWFELIQKQNHGLPLLMDERPKAR
jgi:hypothetical protein